MSEEFASNLGAGAGSEVEPRFLSDAQRRGLACVVCHGTEGLDQHVGWIDGVSVRAHSHHVESYRRGENGGPDPPSRTRPSA